MYLSNDQVAALSECYRVLASADDLHELRHLLAPALARALRAQSLVSRDFDADSRRYAISFAHNLDEAHAQRYEAHFQFCDPITPVLQPLRCGGFAHALPRAQLVRTEFYNDFLRPYEMHRGLNLYACDGDAFVGDMLAFRSERQPEFEEGELAILRMLEPSFTAALLRLRKVRTAPAPAAAVVDDAALLGVLARQSLTPREAEVALLVFRGCADKEIARSLQLQPTTVRYYLNNAADKLGARGRARLAHRVSQLAAAPVAASVRTH